MRRLFVTLLFIAGACAHTAPAPQLAHPTAPAAEPADTDSIGITWIGHATVLIRLGQRWFLTDPVLGDHIAGVYPRTVAAGIDPRDLPPLDAVLVSHSHFDHLDVPSLRRLAGVPVLVPPGSAQFLPRAARAHAIALDTWQSWTIGDVTITAVPSSHSSARYGIDQWRRHGHCGFVLAWRGHTVYFAGDTGLDLPQTRAIAARFHVDVALIPVGPAGRAHWIERLRRSVHVTPDDAMHLFDAVGADWMVPIHFGTFYATMARELPYVQRAIAASPRGGRVRVLGIGETTEFLY